MTGVSTLAQAMSQIERLKVSQNSFDDLSRQLSSGKKTDKFSGLGSDVITSKRARADFKALETYQTNITLANNRVSEMLTSLREFREQTEHLRDFMVNLSKESAHQKGDYIRQDDPLTPLVEEVTPIGYSSSEMDVHFRTMQQFAGSIKEFMNELINRKDGDRYIFGGANALEKPLNDTGALDAAVSTMIVNWKSEAAGFSTTEIIADVNERTATLGNPNAITDSIVGYNPTLSGGSAGKVSARVNEYTEVNYTSFANNQGFRDVMVVISALGNENLPPIADVYAEPYSFGDPTTADGAPGATLEEQEDNFFEFFQAMTSMVTGALDSIDDEIVSLENSRVRLNQAKQVNIQQINIAKGIFNDVEGVDLNEVAVKVTAVKNSLEASYQITARLQQLSLVNFL